jgi:monoamine oxidase
LRARYGDRRDGPTRREMLRRTLVGAAGLLLSERVAFGQRPGAPRVLVVGAGFAGLALAHELGAAGYDVRVFEARNRLGGRVRSFHDMARVAVEGGGELIGSNHPAWVSYQRKFGLTFVDVPDYGDLDAPVVIGGRALTRAEGAALWEEMERAYARLNDLAAPVIADAPWTTPEAAALDRATVAAWIDAADLSPLCRTALHAEFSADNGVDTAWQSQLGNLAQIKGGGLDRYWTDSEVFRCEGGNQQLANRLARTLAPGALRLNTPVTKIVTTDRGAGVTCADGTVVEGDDVVLAVPPSVWPRIAFEPALPTALRPQMGINVKYLASVTSRFWERARLTPELLSDGPIQLTWEATGNQHSDAIVLTSFSGGSAAAECRSWAPGERANRYLRAIEVGLKDVAHEFVRGRFMDWPNDRWTMAAYAFPAPGEVTTVGPLLREGRGRLHFAGEHTNFAFIGYMEGALGSGIALATRIAERDGVITGTTGTRGTSGTGYVGYVATVGAAANAEAVATVGATANVGATEDVGATANAGATASVGATGDMRGVRSGEHIPARAVTMAVRR